MPHAGSPTGPKVFSVFTTARAGTHLLKFLLVVCALCVCVSQAAAQDNIEFTQGGGGSGMENSLRIPLRTYPGRGGANLNVTLHYSSKVWRLGHLDTFVNSQWAQLQTVAEAVYSEHATAGWTTSLDPPRVEWPKQSDTYNSSGKESCAACGTGGGWRVGRVFVHMAGGATYELRSGDNAYSGAMVYDADFYSVDGSRLRYDCDSVGAGTLYLPDGSRYLLNNGDAQFVDRNGNTLSYSASTRQWTDALGRVVGLPWPASPQAGDYHYTLPGVPGQYTFRWRSLSNALAPGSPALRSMADRYLPSPGLPPTGPSGSNFPQPTGTSSLFTSAYADDDSVVETLVVGRGQTGGESFNPVVLAEINLPDGTSYKFSYNIYGEIEKVTHPAGGYDRYVYNAVPSASDTSAPYTQANRGVTLREQRARGDGSDKSEWVYAAARVWDSAFVGAHGNLVITATAPDKTVTETYLRILRPVPFGANNAYYWPFGYEDPRSGLPYDVRTYAPNPDGTRGPLIRRQLTEWEMSSQVIPQRLGFQGERVVTAYRNARQKKSVGLLLDTGGDALSSAVAYQYDTAHQFSTGVELTAAAEYHFAAVAQATAETGAIGSMPLGALARTTETEYMTSNADYRARHLLGLPKSDVTKNAAGAVVSKKETFYDESSYPLLTYAAVTGWTNPQTSVRGNATTVRLFIDPAAGTYLETHAQYDQCGSTRNIWNAHESSSPAHGRQSQFLYDDAFSDGVPRNTYAYPTKSISPTPDPTGARGSNTPLEATSVFDYATGVVTSATDANNQTTSYFYADDLGTPDPVKRLRKVTQPGGGWTRYNYGFASNAGVSSFFVETTAALDGARSVTSREFVDGLGRSVRAFVQVGPSAYDTTDTVFDATGRVEKTSQPYRTSSFNDAVTTSNRWTRRTYDALGRVLTVKSLADDAVTSIAYSGARVLVTDPANRQRLSQTDALGRLTDVWEIRTADADTIAVSFPGRPEVAAGYRTTYTYDALGNLRRVEQGHQSRFYMFDALSRLLRVKNPEQAANASLGVTDPVTGHASWSLAFSYDQHGNLHTRTDARGVVTSYTYDNLNRQTGVTYQHDPANTLAVSLFYDNQPNARGALWKVATAGHYTETLDRDAVGRPRTNRQAFNDGLWRFYDTTYTYNLAGQILTQTYPSGRSVSYQYDDAGRLSDFRGTLGDGTLRVYSTGVQYDEAGRVRQEQFGTQVPVYNKSFYNVRGQLSEIRVSTHSLTSPGEATNWNRGAIINHYSDQSWAGSGTDNNGNLVKQDIYVPGDDAILTHTLRTQQFTYDALNRLERVREFGGGPDRVQDYDYDRYGNRTINAANTSDGIPKPQFTVDANTNRLNVPAGQTGGMQYDLAGNLTADTYSSNAAVRRYDAENHLYEELNASNQQTGRYTYDGAGRRVRRKANGQETWYVYGAGGELVAEYATGFTGASAQQEYGYRGGEMLVVASPYGEQGLKGDYFNGLDFTGASLTRTDANIDFEWHGASPGAGVGADIFTARWTGFVTPRFTETYTFYTQSDDGVRLWVDGQLVVDKWVDQGWTEWSGQITLQANRRYEIKMEFYERYGGAIAKLLWESASQAKEVVPSSRLTPPGGSPVRWLVRDQLGTPRMTLDQTGSLSKMTRHDYLPFGEELKAGVGGRTIEQGYQADGVRQQFTGHERDSETGFDFMQARYYSGAQGRFTSVDSVAGSAADPRSLNLYAYVLGNPMRYNDPTGHAPSDIGVVQTDDPVEARAAQNSSHNDQARTIQRQRQRERKRQRGASPRRNSSTSTTQSTGRGPVPASLWEEPAIATITNAPTVAPAPLGDGPRVTDPGDAPALPLIAQAFLAAQSALSRRPKCQALFVNTNGSQALTDLFNARRLRIEDVEVRFPGSDPMMLSQTGLEGVALNSGVYLNPAHPVIRGELDGVFTNWPHADAVAVTMIHETAHKTGAFPPDAGVRLGEGTGSTSHHLSVMTLCFPQNKVYLGPR